MYAEKQVLDKIEALMNAKIAEYTDGRPLKLDGETEVLLDLFAEHAGYHLYFGHGIGIVMKWRPEDFRVEQPPPKIAANVSPVVGSQHSGGNGTVW